MHDVNRMTKKETPKELGSFKLMRYQMASYLPVDYYSRYHRPSSVLGPQAARRFLPRLLPKESGHDHVQFSLMHVKWILVLPHGVSEIELRMGGAQRSGVFGSTGWTTHRDIQVRDPRYRGRSVEYCIIEHNQPANSFTFFYILANLIITMGGAKVRTFPSSR